MKYLWNKYLNRCPWSANLKIEPVILQKSRLHPTFSWSFCPKRLTVGLDEAAGNQRGVMGLAQGPNSCTNRGYNRALTTNLPSPSHVHLPWAAGRAGGTEGRGLGARAENGPCGQAAGGLRGSTPCSAPCGPALTPCSRGRFNASLTDQGRSF